MKGKYQKCVEFFEKDHQKLWPSCDKYDNVNLPQGKIDKAFWLSPSEHNN